MLANSPNAPLIVLYNSTHYDLLSSNRNNNLVFVDYRLGHFETLPKVSSFACVSVIRFLNIHVGTLKCVLIA